METIFQEHGLLILVAWILLAIIRKPLGPLVTQLTDIVSTPFDSANKGMVQVAQQGQGTEQAIRDTNERLVEIVIEIFVEVRHGLTKIEEKANQYCRSLMRQVAPEARYRALQVAWSLCELALLPLFIYADMAQTANNLTTLLPNEPVPEFLRSLSIPLMVSSVGTVFVLGIVLGDFVGLTHVGGWSRLRGRLRRFMLVVIWLTLLLALTCSLLLALNRAAVLAETRGFPLDPGINQLIFWLSDFSQSFLILSLLVTSILLVRALNGLILLSLIPVQLFRVVCGVTAFMIRLIEILLSAGEIMSGLSLTFIGLFVRGSWTIVGGLFGLVGMLTGKIFSALYEALNVFTYPLEWVGQGAAELARQSPWFKEPSIPTTKTQTEADELEQSLPSVSTSTTVIQTEVNKLEHPSPSVSTTVIQQSIEPAQVLDKTIVGQSNGHSTSTLGSQDSHQN